MKELPPQPLLVEQVHEAILAEIAGGTLPPGSRLIQARIAQALGVSRQPVQQALLLLRNQGVLRDAPGRGLIVTRLDLDDVRHRYELRAVIEGLACRKAAEVGAYRARRFGPALIRNGRKAARSGSSASLIASDLAFHRFLYELSGNPLIAPAMEAHWAFTRRVMGEVLRDERPRDIWDQHERLLRIIADGDAAGAEQTARRHVAQASRFMLKRLANGPDRKTPAARPAGRRVAAHADEGTSRRSAR